MTGIIGAGRRFIRAILTGGPVLTDGWAGRASESPAVRNGSEGVAPDVDEPAWSSRWVRSPPPIRRGPLVRLVRSARPLRTLDKREEVLPLRTSPSVDLLCTLSPASSRSPPSALSTPRRPSTCLPSPSVRSSTLCVLKAVLCDDVAPCPRACSSSATPSIVRLTLSPSLLSSPNSAPRPARRRQLRARGARAARPPCPRRRSGRSSLCVVSLAQPPSPPLSSYPRRRPPSLTPPTLPRLADRRRLCYTLRALQPGVLVRSLRARRGPRLQARALRDLGRALRRLLMWQGFGCRLGR